MHKQFFLFSLLVIGCCSLTAQTIQLYDPVASRTFNTNKYSAIRGTPFIIDKWLKGTVTTEKGVYQNLELKFDAFENTLFFNKDDEAFEFADKVLGFTLQTKANEPKTAMVFKKGLSASGLTANQFVQVLVEGKLNLYRSDIKSVTEMSEINAGMVKTFATITRYYVVKGNQVQLIRLNKNELLELTNDQAAAIDKFIQEQKISFKKERDMIDLFVHYNSL